MTLDSKFSPLTSSDYAYAPIRCRSSFKPDSKDGSKPDERVMKSLQWYERSTAFLKGQIKLLNIQHSKDLKVKVFEKIATASLNAPIPS